MLQSDKKQYYMYMLYAFLLGAGVFILAELPYLIQNGGIYYFYSDFDYQSVPFLIRFNREAAGFSVPQYDFTAGAGLDYIVAYSFYNLFSPFTLLFELLPQGAAIYAIPYFIGLKFGVSAFSAFVYAKRFCRKNETALVAALLYAFSGYSLFNLTYHFLDSLALFPLLMTSLEAAVKDKTRGFFGVMAALCALTNFYMFGMEAIFIVLYFAVRFTDKAFRITLKDFLCLAAETLLGIAAAAIVLIPMLIAIAESPRLNGGYTLFSALVYDSPWRYPRILQQFYMFSDLQGYTNFFPDFGTTYPYGSRLSSMGAYLPLFGITGVIAFMKHNKKLWQSRLIILCLVFSLVPILNSVFSLGSGNYYARWMFCPVLIMAVMTGATLEDEAMQGGCKIGLIISGALLLLTTAFTIIFPMEKLSLWEPLAYFNTLHTVVQIAVTLLFLVLTALLMLKTKRDKDFMKKLIIFTAAAAFVFTDATLLLGMSDTRYPSLITDIHKNPIQLEAVEKGRRVAESGNMTNSACMNGYMSVTYFSTFANSNAIELYQNLGYDAEAGVSLDESYSYALCCLMSMREYLAMSNTEEEHFDDYVSADEYSVLLNKNYIPIGFTYEYYIPRDKFEKLDDRELKERLLLKAMVADEPAQVSGYLKELPDSMLYKLSDSEFSAECANRAAKTADSFRFDGSSYTASTSFSEDNLVFFSVAYDNCFTAYIDNEPTDIIKANIGFQAIEVPKGQHTIRVVYSNPIRRISAFISIAGAVLLAAYISIAFILKRRKRIDTKSAE